MATDPGEGRPWVLLPGTLCTGAVFDGFLDRLGVPEGARSVVPMRHPGVEDYAPDLAQTTPPGAVLCGFSLGAIVAAHLAARLRPSQIVLFALNPHADDPAKRENRLALAEDVARKGGAAALAGRLAPLTGPDPAAARARILAMAQAAGPHITAQTALALNRPSALVALAGTATPITFLTGTEDTLAPLAFVRDAAALSPRGRVIALQGLGHYALLEDPAECARAFAEHPEDA